jgi:hypothetical protein
MSNASKTFSQIMKRTLFALTMLAVVLPALPQARADVSIDFFYNNLSGGNWIEVEGYGYGWQPDLAVSESNWRPYADGYWTYTDYGWTWISYEDFGWATYHYGRWASLADYGWIWFPGSDLEWGPAWVSWRTGGDYVGWAPLPPRGPGAVYSGQPIGGRVDIEFGIGPAYYNFIDVRFIGEPVLRDRIFAPSQNATYINNTVNVTNITVQNNVVYNYGPNYETLSSYSSRPIQRLKIERKSSANLSAAVKSGALTKVQGDKLIVAAPEKINKAPAGSAPPKVKAKVAQPKIEKGWAGVANKAELEEKIKTENPKNVPPPTGAAAKGRAKGEASPGARAPTAGVSPMVSPGAAGSPIKKGKGRGRPGREVKPSGTATPGAPQSPAAAGTPTERGKRLGRPTPQSGLTGTPAESPRGARSRGIKGTPPGKEPGRPGRGRLETSPSPRGQTGAALTTPESTQPKGKQRGRPERGGASLAPQAPRAEKSLNQSESLQNSPRNKPDKKQEGQISTIERQRPERGRPPGQATSPSGPPSSGAAAGETQAGRQKGQGRSVQPGQTSGGQPAGTKPGQGKAEHGKKKGQETSPTPGRH